MIKFNFNQTGGFKMITQIFSRMQDSYSIFNGVAKMAGDKAILSGCVVNGTNVSDGTVVIGGETLEFKGGILQTTVIIVDSITTAVFKDGSVKNFENNKYATFGFSATAVPWADFKRVPVLNLLPQQLTDMETNLTTKINNLKNAIGFVKKGNIFIGDINNKTIGWNVTTDDYSVTLLQRASAGTAGGDDYYRVDFITPLDDMNYQVFTSINYSGGFNENNDVIMTISNKTAAGFNVSFREVSPDVQNINFDYIIFKK